MYSLQLESTGVVTSPDCIRTEDSEVLSLFEQLVFLVLGENHEGGSETHDLTFILY